MIYREDDGGFGPETVFMEKECAACGVKFSKYVVKGTIARHRLCYPCRGVRIPITHTLNLEEHPTGAE